MAIGVVVIGGLVFVVLSSTKGAHLQLQGKILKARTGGLSDADSVAVLDFRIQNTSDIPFVVRQVKVTLEKANGEKSEGNEISKIDMKQLFQFNRFLGDPYNDALSIRDRVPPHGQIDRMVAARFEVPQAQLESGKAIQLWIQDMDGAEFETVYKPK
jgi:hypothetical protein